MSRKYFAQITPGLEQLLSSELKGLGARRREVSRGGVSFEGTRKHLYRALLGSRLASRVWLTLYEGTAPNQDALFERAVKLPWERYLASGSPLALRGALHRAQLAGSGQVESVLWSAIQTRLKAHGHSIQRGAWGAQEPTQRVLAHLEGPRCQIRLDGAGAHLHKRGWRSAEGPAPLRPNLAWACLKALDWRAGEALVDPMCGGGTFTIEALSASCSSRAQRRPGFACLDWPEHDESLWREVSEELSAPLELSLKPSFWMSELIEERLELARQNLARATALGYSSLREGVTLTQADALNLSWAQLCEPWSLSASPERGLLIVNPPYGRRVHDEGLSSDTTGLSVAQRLIDALPELIGPGGRGWRAGILVPSELRLQTPAGWRCEERLRFSHGGIPVSLWRLGPP